MEFVDLKRSFVPIKKNADSSEAIAFGPVIGHEYGGWLDWSQLLDYPRVVLLAEAASGKSVEFKHAAASLQAKGSIALYATIEQLADQNFLADPTERISFEKWQAGGGPAWFFLDSVDEARLNRKRFDDALRSLASSLGKAMARARILVSCRVSDWKNNSDRATILDILPIESAPPPPLSPSDPDKALLDPIFERNEEPSPKEKEADEEQPASDVLVVQLVPLTKEQRRMLAIAFGVTDAEVDAFLKAIEQNGLDVLAERPGDLRELAVYWRENKQFGTLANMTEAAVVEKLREADAYRPDNSDLTPQMARLGAERLAGALTLAKTFSLVAPGSEADATLAQDALNATTLLDNWTVSQSNALLRRGVFAPSTYGRVRFHHRSTQEYLAARWLDWLLNEGCERSEVADLLFVEAYGVKTVAPSLRATAAWLAIRRPEFRKEIVSREPLLLMTHGDPGSLPVETKTELLLHLAKRHANGDIADDSVDRRALWMFASPELGDAIRHAWKLNTRSDFRTDLVRLVREGAISDCVDLAARMAADAEARDFSRNVAIEALVACSAESELRKLIAAVLRSKAGISPRLASGFAGALFPDYLSVKQLLGLMAKCAEDENTFEGFSYTIDELWTKCPTAEREAFIDGVANLCGSPPFVDAYRRVSRRYVQLAKHLGKVGRSAMMTLKGGTPSSGLIRLLAVIERAERGSHTEEKPALNQLLRSNTAANRALFWHDVAEVRAHREKKEEKVIEIWHVYIGGSPLWDLAEQDLPWLLDDLGSLSDEDDRRVALSAIFRIMGNSFRSKRADLAKRIRGNPTLALDLNRYLTPTKPDPAIARHQREQAARQRESEKQRNADKAAWIKFRAELLAQPSKLKDAAGITNAPTFNWMLNLTKWLRRKTGRSWTDAPLDWRLLEPAFGAEVAKNYREGMKALWRTFEPERPVQKGNGERTVKWLTILSFAGVSVEAASDPGFALKLDEKEIHRAALHGCLAEQGYPEWIKALITANPSVVVPIVVAEFEAEWTAVGDSGGYYIYPFARESSSLHPALQAQLYRIITASEPASTNKLDHGLGILRRISTTAQQRGELRKLALLRFEKHANADEPKPVWAARYLAFLFFLDPQDAFRILTSWLGREVKAKRGKLAELVLALLFGRRDGLAVEALTDAPVATLEALVHFAYQMIHPDQDRVHEGVYETDARDDAEQARNSILTALIESRGAEAYAAMIRLSGRSDMKRQQIRFRELARRMAERDSDHTPWPPADVLAFEQSHALPVRTGVQLYRVAKKLLEEIAWDFAHEDSSSRAVLETARDEDAVQHYLAEQLRLRSKKRFHRVREGEVAEGNMPDIILAATQGMAQIAIEAKHGGKNWSTTTLASALRGQLAEDYLRPSYRRHGLLVVTNHKKRGWTHPRTRKRISFQEMIAYLNDLAATITQNSVGEVAVAVVGIDALPRARTRSRPRGRAN